MGRSSQLRRIAEARPQPATHNPAIAEVVETRAEDELVVRIEGSYLAIARRTWIARSK